LPASVPAVVSDTTSDAKAVSDGPKELSKNESALVRIHAAVYTNAVPAFGAIEKG